MKKNSMAILEEKRKNTKRESIVPQKKKKLKKAIAVVACVFAVLVILYGALALVSDWLKETDGKNSEGNSDELNFNPEGILSVDYYEPDYSADIFSDKEYLAKDRSIRFTDGNISIVLNEYEDDELDAGQRFFKKYFDAVVNGDYESYSKMIADDYSGNPAIYGENPKTKKFPMQRVYNINVKKLAFSDDENNVYNGRHAIFGIYEVSYCISKNDGEFRLGLPSDKSIPIIYQTATFVDDSGNEKTVITTAYSYDDIAGKSEGNEAK